MNLENKSNNKERTKHYSHFDSKKFTQHNLHSETEKELAKKTLASLVASGGVLAIALTIAVNIPKLANQKYNIDGNKVVYSYGLTHNKIIEYKEKGKIKYIENPFLKKGMEKVNINKVNYSSKDTGIYKQFEGRYNYLSNKIKEIEEYKYNAKKAQKIQEKPKN